MTASKITQAPETMPPLIERWKAARIRWADAKRELAVAKAALEVEKADRYLALRGDGVTIRDADEQVTIAIGKLQLEIYDLARSADIAWAEAQALAFEIGLAAPEGGDEAERTR